MNLFIFIFIFLAICSSSFEYCLFISLAFINWVVDFLVFFFVYFFVCSRLIFCQVQLSKVFSHPIGNLFFLLVCYAEAFSVHGSHCWLLPWFSELAHVQKTFFLCLLSSGISLLLPLLPPASEFRGFGGFWFLCRVVDIFYMLISSFPTIIWIVYLQYIFFTSL